MSCISGPIQSPPTISFKLHAKTVEEIDVQKCNFRNFWSSVTLTLTLDRSRSHWCAYLVKVYPHTKLDGNRKTFYGRTYGRTYGWTDTPEFQSTRSLVGDDLKMGDGGGGHWLVRMEWRPAGWSVCLPLLIFPCTIKSRSSLLTPAHLGGPRERAIKNICVWWCGTDVSDDKVVNCRIIYLTILLTSYHPNLFRKKLKCYCFATQCKDFF